MLNYPEINLKKYSNPVQRGFFPDPSVIRVGEDYYMVNSSFQYFPAIPISHSTDLVHWEIIGHAITDNSYLDLSETLDSRGVWASDISYHNGKFYIFATLRHNSEDKQISPMRTQLIMTSDKPEGSYSKPIEIPVDSIDPSHFIDDDGKHYMIISPGIVIVPLNDDCTKINGEIVKVWDGTGERCPEGPHILKKDGWYYAIIAEGGTGYGHGINVARSKSLFGSYESCPYNPVMRQKNPDAPIQRTGHGKLVQTQNGDWWCFYLCGRRNGGNYTTIGRETALDPVQWTNDGWFLVNNGSPSLEQNYPQNLKETIFPKFNFDDFDNEKLNLNWEWVRNPDTNNFSLTERAGHLRLYTLDGTLNQIKAKNTLLRREQELSYTAKTKMSFNPTEKGFQAGLTCYYSTASYVRFSLIYDNGLCLELVINRNNGEERMNIVRNIKSNDIYLKVVVNGLRREFYFSYDNQNWQNGGILDNCIYLCDEGVPKDRKRHTGTLVGIYANNGGNTENNKKIFADFDWFSYDD